MGRLNSTTTSQNVGQVAPTDQSQREPEITRSHISQPLSQPTTSATSPALEQIARASPLLAETRPPTAPQFIRPNSPPKLPRLPTEPLIQPTLDTVAELARSVTRGGGTSAPLEGLVAVVTPSEIQPPPSAPRRKPKAKVLLCTDKWQNEAERAIYLNDLKCFKAACLKNIPGLVKDDIRTNLYGEEMSTDVGSNFGWFFDPDDIVPGDILIMLVTGHGNLYSAHGKTSVRLNLFTSTGRQIDTSYLNSKISKLPEHCTLEVVMGTCHAEGTISGLRQVRIMASGPDSVRMSDLAAERAPSSSPSAGPSRPKRAVVAAPPIIPQNATPPASLPNWSGGLFAPAESSNGAGLLETKACVILWAAAQVGGKAFSEAYTKRKRQFCVLVGAIYRAWSPKHPNITRRAVAERVQQEVTFQYEERVKLNSATPDAVRPTQRHTQGPVVQAPDVPSSLVQVAMLLSTERDPNRVLDTPIFQALDPGPPFNKSLMGMSAGGKVKEA